MPLVCFVAFVRERFPGFGHREVVGEKLRRGFDDIICLRAGRGQRAVLLGVGVHEYGQGTSTQQEGNKDAR